MQPNEDNIEKHFPNTAKLLHEREAKSESPARSRGESVCEDHGENDEHNHAEDEEAALRLQERLARASARRETVLEARRLAQAEASAHRKQKLEQVAALRRNAVRTFIKQAPDLIATLMLTGLREDTSATPEIIEQILIADPRVCGLCNDPSGPLAAVCPHNQKPHRRSLVVVSEQLLKMIGNTKVNLSPAKPENAANDAEVVAPRARRGIRVQPHLFVLAYYYAAMPSGSQSSPDADSLLQLSATHLVALIAQLRRLCIEASANDEQLEVHTPLVADLLTSFAKTWRQYAKLADAQSRPSEGERDPASRRKVIEDLIQSTTDAVVAATVSHATTKERSAQDAEAILLFVDLMYMRLREIGGVGAVEQARAKAEAAVASVTQGTPVADASSDGASPKKLAVHDMSTPPQTPESKPQQVRMVVQPVAPLRLSADGPYTGTSSDTDHKGGDEPTQQVIYGPGLPPNWFVDAQGVSRPPPTAVANALYGEKRQRLELRARTAFQTKLRLADPPSQEETATEKLMEEMRDAALMKLKSDLNQSPPDLTRLPSALSSIADALVEALPTKLRAKIGKEIKDVLDWSAVRRNVRHSENNIAELMRYVVTRVIELGAPARDAPLRQECSNLESRLNSREDSLGDIVADMFRFMLSAIRQLRLDISAFTLTMISDELAKHAEEYHAEFFTECLPQPSRWSKTLEFFQDALSGDVQEVKNFLEKHATAMSSVASTPLERVMRAGLFLGTVELLRSANRNAEDRWAMFPSEAMTIEKQQLFDAANTVQQDTLSLMLSGVTSMILQSKRLKERTTLGALLTALDVKLRGEFLPLASSVSHLQELIRTEIDFFLADDAYVESPTSLTDAERAVLNSMIEKMTDVKTIQYATFEGRVITAVLNSFALSPREAQSIPVAQRPRTIGLASDSAFKNGAKLRCVLDYHWNVLRTFYVDMSRHLQIPDELLAAANVA